MGNCHAFISFHLFKHIRLDISVTIVISTVCIVRFNAKDKETGHVWKRDGVQLKLTFTAVLNKITSSVFIGNKSEDVERGI